MSGFDEEKDYDLDYFTSHRDKNNNPDEAVADDASIDESFDLNAFSTMIEKDNITFDTVESSEEGVNDENVDIDFASFGKKRKDIKKDEKKDKRVKAKKTAKTVGKVIVSIILIGIITGCLVIGAFAVYVFNFVDDNVYEDLDELKLDFTTTIYVENGETGDYVEYQRLHGSENRIWVGFDEMPDDLLNAFVAVEDQRFRDHNGVDWKRTVSAFANMFVHFYSSNQGGSTITQQLVKNLTGDNEQTPMRKIREIMRARYLEKEYEKDTILECYLNTICLAGGMYGVEVASNYYFGKSVGELTLVECASLASLAKEPEKYRPDKNPENNKNRRNLVLKLMYDQGYISEDVYNESIATELTVVADKTAISDAKVNNYFVDALIEEVIDRMVEEYGFDESYASKNFYNGGYKIYCTIDPEIQAIMEDEYSKTGTYFYPKSKKTGESVQSAMTIMDYEGHIVALVGGAGGSAAKTENRGYNRATMGYRQPGSTMKPLAAYSLAIQKNLINYSSILDDHPIDNYFGAGKAGPNNWYGYYSGGVTAAYALERSINTIPCKLVKQMGVETTYYHLTTSLGLYSLDPTDDMNLSSLGLGGTSTGITTTMSAAAFAVFGNLGNYYEPTTFTLMTDQHGKTVLKQADGIQALDENTATIMNHMLQGPVYGSNGTASAAQGFSSTMRCYAKTGTSSETNDCWLVGGTPYYVASCWFGYDKLEAVTPSNLAQLMWVNVMKRVHADLEAKDFVDSEFVTRRYYCASTGMLATDMCTDIREGYYKTNYSLPSACTVHKGTLLPEITDIVEGEDSGSENENTGGNTEEPTSPDSGQTEEDNNPTPPADVETENNQGENNGGDSEDAGDSGNTGGSEGTGGNGDDTGEAPDSN